MSVSTSTALLHPPSIVHFRSSSTDFPSIEEDDCSTISSAPNSPGRASREDSDEEHEEDHSPSSLHVDSLLLASGDVLQLSIRERPSELQRKNSELGRQSRKSRLRRASLKFMRQQKQNVCDSDDHPAALLEEKKSADDESTSSSVDFGTQNHKKRHCSEEQTLERPEDRSVLDHSTCSTIPQNEAFDDDEEEGDDLPLLPRHKKTTVVLHEEREYSTSSSTTATRDPSSASTTRWMLESPPPNDDESSPMDEVDELEVPTSSLDRSQPETMQHLSNEDQPPTIHISPSLPLVDDTSLQLQNSRPTLVWKESESFDDDLDLVMSPTDEIFCQHPAALDSKRHHNAVISAASLQGCCTQSFNKGPSNDEVPLDEKLHSLSLMPSFDDSDDIPPITRIHKYSTEPSPPNRTDPPGSSATNAITVEDLIDWTNHANEESENPLDVSQDSSSASDVGPLIRLEQHQPLLLQSLDEISSSDETPLTGNGPVTRVHGTGGRIRNRIYGEPKLHDYWKSKGQSAHRARHRHARRRPMANDKCSKSSVLPHSSQIRDESSLDRILPPLIIDPEQLRSIGVNAIIAVCNGIGSLFLSNGEATESPKEKKTSSKEPYKPLSKDEKQTKKRSRGNKKKDLSRLVLDDLSQTESSLSAFSSFRHPIDDNILLNATPLYFEAALQQSIEAELKVGDTLQSPTSNSPPLLTSRFDNTKRNNDFAKKSKTRQTINPFNAQFADFTKELRDTDVSDSPYHLKRTRSVPVTSPSCSREEVDQLWMEKVRAIKKNSNHIEPFLASEDERRAPVPVHDVGEEESLRMPKVKGGISHRIAALRRTKKSPPPASATFETANVSENNLYSPSLTVASTSDRNPLLSPVTPVIDQSGLCDISPADHTPLAGPPPLRRLNVSLDFPDSFGPDFSKQAFDLDEPPSLVRSKKVASQQLSSADFAEKPSSNRSPMSDFLLLRLQASSSDVSSTDLQNSKVARADRTNMTYDSDCSSTEELVSRLDGLVRDLDGMASSRRIERKQTSDSQSSDPILLHDIHLLSDFSSSEKVSAKLANRNVIGVPVLVELLANDHGIPTGDIMISLLNTEQVEPTFTSRVDASIWRSRTMRRQNDIRWLDHIQRRKSVSIPSQRRTSVCVDVDDVRVMGGIEKLGDTEPVALEYLMFDDFDDALVLYDDICLSYEQFMENLDPCDERRKLLKHHLATAQFNLGVVHSLRGEQDEALDYFENSTQLFSDCLGARHFAHVTSLARTAMCRFALEDYSTAYGELELALSLSRDCIQSLSDYRQVAEILNSLGCLSYMGGEIERAMSFFRQSMQVLTKAEELALYSESQFDGYSTMLALSIAKSNIAFLSLTFYRDVSESVTLFESVVKDQQVLFRESNTTITTTMEHLAAANLLAGHVDRALQMLRRVLQFQLKDGNDQADAGQRTRHKIAVLEGREDIATLAESTDVGSKVLPILETSRESSSSS